jgi:agmatinase
MEIAPFTDSCGQGVAGQEKTLKVGADISAFLLKEMARN